MSSPFKDDFEKTVATWQPIKCNQSVMFLPQTITQNFMCKQTAPNEAIVLNAYTVSKNTNQYDSIHHHHSDSNPSETQAKPSSSNPNPDSTSFRLIHKRE